MAERIEVPAENIPPIQLPLKHHLTGSYDPDLWEEAGKEAFLRYCEKVSGLPRDDIRLYYDQSLLPHDIHTVTAIWDVWD